MDASGFTITKKSEKRGQGYYTIVVRTPLANNGAKAGIMDKEATQVFEDEVK